MTVRSTQGQNKAVRSTQGGGVSPSHIGTGFVISHIYMTFGPKMSDLNTYLYFAPDLSKRNNTDVTEIIQQPTTHWCKRSAS